MDRQIKITPSAIKEAIDNLLEENELLKIQKNEALQYMSSYIKNEPSNGSTHAVKIEFAEVIKILRKRDFIEEVSE